MKPQLCFFLKNLLQLPVFNTIQATLPDQGQGHGGILKFVSIYRSTICHNKLHWELEKVS